MKKKIVIVIGLISLILILGIIGIKNSQDKKTAERIISNQYNENKVLLSIENIKLDKKNFLIILNEDDNNSNISKYNMIKGYTDLNEKKHITELTTINTKQYKEIIEKINNVDHYYEQIKTPCYTVKIKDEDSFFVIIDDIDIKLY